MVPREIRRASRAVRGLAAFGLACSGAAACGSGVASSSTGAADAPVATTAGMTPTAAAVASGGPVTPPPPLGPFPQTLVGEWRSPDHTWTFAAGGAFRGTTEDTFGNGPMCTGQAGVQGSTLRVNVDCANDQSGSPKSSATAYTFRLGENPVGARTLTVTEASGSSETLVATDSPDCVVGGWKTPDDAPFAIRITIDPDAAFTTEEEQHDANGATTGFCQIKGSARLSADRLTLTPQQSGPGCQPVDQLSADEYVVSPDHRSLSAQVDGATITLIRQS